MGFPRILFTKEFLTPAALTASSTESGFSVNDIIDLKPWKMWKSGTLVTGITIDFDMGASADWANCLGLVNHNIGAEAGTIEVKADNTNPPATTRITAYTPTSDNVEIKDFATHAASRYYRITLAKGGNFANKPFIGELILGNVMTFPEYMDPEMDPFDKQTEGVLQHSEGGQYLGAIVRGKTHREPLNIGVGAGMARSFYTSDLNNFINNHYDAYRPFIFQLDKDDADFSTAFYLVKPSEGQHRRQAIGGMWNRMSLNLAAVEAFMERA